MLEKPNRHFFYGMWTTVDIPHGIDTFNTPMLLFNLPEGTTANGEPTTITETYIVLHRSMTIPNFYIDTQKHALTFRLPGCDWDITSGAIITPAQLDKIVENTTKVATGYIVDGDAVNPDCNKLCMGMWEPALLSALTYLESLGEATLLCKDSRRDKPLHYFVSAKFLGDANPTEPIETTVLSWSLAANIDEDACALAEKLLAHAEKLFAESKSRTLTSA